jgi:ABC-type multidrug transport system fused ATPase/permease subunit
MIMVMEAVEIVERGSHQVLIKKQGKYWKMWQLQQEGDTE